MPDNVRRYRRCYFCGCATFVLMPPGATDLDVSARFSEQGREFAQAEDGEPVGVACHPCSKRYQPAGVRRAA